MQCPACQRPLRRFKAGTVMLDGCDGGCAGIWFDHDELASVGREQPQPGSPVASLLRDPAVQVEDNAARMCPRCDGVALDKKLYSLGSGVVLDRCLHCRGVWLDHGELEKIRNALDLGLGKPGADTCQPPLRIPVTFDLVEQVRILHLGA